MLISNDTGPNTRVWAFTIGTLERCGIETEDGIQPTADRERREAAETMVFPDLAANLRFTEKRTRQTYVVLIITFNY